MRCGLYRFLAAPLTALLLVPGLLSAHGGIEERIAFLNARISADPSDPELYLLRGALWSQTEHWERALADYDRALLLEGDKAEVDLARSKLLLATGQPALAEAVLDGVLAAAPHHPKTPQLLRLRAQARAAQGRLSPAADDLSLAIDAMTRPSPQVFVELVRILTAAGRGREALAYLERGEARLGSLEVLQREAARLDLGRDPAESRPSPASPPPRDTGGPGLPHRNVEFAPNPLPHVAALIRGPYLQLGTPTSVVVRWRTGSPTDSRIRYGTDLADLDMTVDDLSLTTEHEVGLENLLPDTIYYYSVGSTAGPLAGGDTEHHFVTSPPAGTVKPIRIWVLGDSGTADANAQAVRDAYLDFTGNRRTDVWLMLGDNAYVFGTDDEYQAAVFDMYPGHLRTGVLWPTLGNHDGISADSNSQTGPYYDLFTLPTQGEAGGVASGTESYYSFDYGNLHFICLESFETDRSPAGAMLTWLEDDLAATTADWVIAFWHHPPYTKGSHDSDLESFHIEMRENALPILEAYGVDLVLGGHSHSYERSFLLDGHYGSSAGLEPSMILDDGDGRPAGDGAYEKHTQGPAPHEGAVYVVAGSSGQATPAPLNHPVMAISLEQLGSLVLDIDGNVLDATFLRSDGSATDSFRLVKNKEGWIFTDGLERGDLSAWSSFSP